MHNPPGAPTPSTEGGKLLNTKKKLREPPRQLLYSAVNKYLQEISGFAAA